MQLNGALKITSPRYMYIIYSKYIILVPSSKTGGNAIIKASYIRVYKQNEMLCVQGRPITDISLNSSILKQIYCICFKTQYLSYHNDYLILNNIYSINWRDWAADTAHESSFCDVTTITGYTISISILILKIQNLQFTRRYHSPVVVIFFFLPNIRMSDKTFWWFTLHE